MKLSTNWKSLTTQNFTAKQQYHCLGGIGSFQVIDNIMALLGPLIQPEYSSRIQYTEIASHLNVLLCPCNTLVNLRNIIQPNLYIAFFLIITCTIYRMNGQHVGKCYSKLKDRRTLGYTQEKFWG